MITMKRGAYISKCGVYRYSLSREWAPGPSCAFVMLNPSTADHEVDDPTIRRCIGYAQRWGFGTLAVVNLFAFRATNPRALASSSDLIGPANDAAICEAVEISGLVIAAWGVHGSIGDRGISVRRMIEEEMERPVHHLGLTKAGHPKHPLYLRSDLQPEEWK